MRIGWWFEERWKKKWFRNVFSMFETLIEMRGNRKLFDMCKKRKKLQKKEKNCEKYKKINPAQRKQSFQQQFFFISNTRENIIKNFSIKVEVSLCSIQPFETYLLYFHLLIYFHFFFGALCILVIDMTWLYKVFLWHYSVKNWWFSITHFTKK